MPQRPNDPLTKDLLDDLDNWFTHPIESFSALLKRGPYAASTRTVYLSMWKRLVQYLEEKGLRIDQCTKHQFNLFIQSDSISPLHQRKYAHVTGMVWTHLRSLGVRGINPGYEYLNKSRENIKGHTTRFLKPETINRIESVLEDVLGQDIPAIGQIETEWIKVRDATIVSLMLGGGLTMEQVMKLTVNCAMYGDGLKLPRIGLVDECSTIIKS